MNDWLKKEQGKNCDSLFKGDYYRLSIPVGMKSENRAFPVCFRPERDTSALISGHWNGIDILINTFILSTLFHYSSDDVQLYLIDFKDNESFKKISHYRLPSVRVVSDNCECECGLNLICELCDELKKRWMIMQRYGVNHIDDYDKIPETPRLPKLIMILNNIQVLIHGEGDEIENRSISLLTDLVYSHAHAVGIHFILATSDFREVVGIEHCLRRTDIRIAVRGFEEGVASVFDVDNLGIKTLQYQPVGTAIFNDGGGVESANNFFQVSYINEEERLDLLTRLDAYYTDPDVAALFEDQQTRVLLTNAEDDIHNCFNRLILEGADSIEHLGKSKDGYGLLLGQGFGKKSIFMPEIRTKERDNLLIVGKDEKMALSLFEFSAMSVLYEELHTDSDKSNALVYIVDLFADELTDEECDFDYLEEHFPQQVKVAKVGEAEELIASLYETVLNRSDGSMPATERIFLMFFGINRARRLRSGKIYEEDRGGELSPIEMLQKIITSGPKYAVNTIVWGESVHSIENMLGDRYDAMFDKRIAFGLDENSMDELVAETEPKSLRGKTAVYMDIAQDVENTHFRPYEIPAKTWIECFSETYKGISK